MHAEGPEHHYEKPFHLRMVSIGGYKMLTQVWFLVNLVFVASFIFYLFAGRACREAEAAGEAHRAKRLRRWRRLTGLLALLAFIATTVVLLVNMAANG